jgi:uncharacterized protein with von Willebrand factor type A (vWA) domain
MKDLYQHQEYSARYGLKHALKKGGSNAKTADVAQKIAEVKYRELIGRELFMSEISDIRELIDELHEWVAASDKFAHKVLTYSI